MGRIKMHLIDQHTGCHEFHVWDWMNARQLKHFIRRQEDGQRYGQAFMNTISHDDYSKLTGTPADPFYSDDEQAVSDAIEYLLLH